jgi:glucose-1-phosphate adenylyltransferase
LQIYGKVSEFNNIPGVFIEENAVIEDSIIMSNCKIGANSSIIKSIIGENVVVKNNVSIGLGEDIPNEIKPNIYYSGITVVGEGAYVPENAQIGKNVVIDRYATHEDFCSLEFRQEKAYFKWCL